jgi:hypothetical protein
MIRGSLCASATAIAPEPVPTSTMLGALKPAAKFNDLLDQVLGLRPRNQHVGVTRNGKP